MFRHDKSIILRIILICAVSGLLFIIFTLSDRRSSGDLSFDSRGELRSPGPRTNQPYDPSPPEHRASALPTAPGHRWITVVNACSQPIANAALEIIPEQTPEAAIQVSTDNAGRAQIRLERGLGRVMVSISAVGYWPYESSWDQFESDSTVGLLAKRAIYGIVARQGNASAGAGVWVIAVEHGTPPPSHEELTSAKSGAPSRLLLAVTDDEGAFCFDHLPSDDGYDLYAGGGSLCLVEPLRRIRAGSASVRVQMSNCYAAHLRFVDQNGQPIIMSSTLADGPLRSNGTYAEGVRAVLDGGITAMLADDGWPTEGAQQGVFSAIYVCDRETDEVGPNWMQVHVPGYSSRPIEFTAYKLSRPARIQEQRLDRVCNGFGGVSIALAENDTQRALNTTSLNGVLLLKGSLGEFWYPASVSVDKVCLIDNVPFGRYEARFVDRQLFSWPLGDAPIVVVQAADVQALVMELERVGMLKLHLQGQSGKTFGGLAQFTLQQTHDESGRQVSTRKAPKLISNRGSNRMCGPMASGRYTLRVISPAPHVAGDLVVDVQSGTTSEVSISLVDH